MEVRVYTPELQLLAIIENYTSLLWTRKYSDAGSFEFHVPTSLYNIQTLALGNIIAYPGSLEAGVIEYIKIQQTSKKNEMVVKGRFLESYLDRRLIHGATKPAYNYSGYTELGMRQIIEDCVPIPLLELGEVKGFTDTITFQATYQSLLKYESKLADSAGLGFRCFPDFVNKSIVFDVYRGLDHTVTQSERVRVTFSEGFKNLDSTTYTENDQLLKTVCYVGGQGEGEDRIWVVVGDDSLVGLERREVKLDATDIDPTDLTTAQYKEKLRQRGEDLLNEKDILVRSFDCDTIPNGNFIYKEHYDLGDIVTLQKESWGMSVDMRITEIREAYEKGKLTISPTFGNPLPDSIDWEDK